MSADYLFRPMSKADLPLVRRWLETPEVVRWWGQPDERFALVSGDLDHSDMEQFIVVLGDRPFAYVQSYVGGTWDGVFGWQPASTHGIDQFIGEADLINCGHRSRFIRQFTERLLNAGMPRVVTDPDPANHRAIRAYAKAGFQPERLVDTPDGQTLLMIREPSPESVLSATNQPAWES